MKSSRYVFSFVALHLILLALHEEGVKKFYSPPVCVVVLFHFRYNSTNNGLLNFYLICQFIIYHCVSSVYFTQLICVYVIKSSPHYYFQVKRGRDYCHKNHTPVEDNQENVYSEKLVMKEVILLQVPIIQVPSASIGKK